MDFTYDYSRIWFVVITLHFSSFNPSNEEEGNPIDRIHALSCDPSSTSPLLCMLFYPSIHPLHSLAFVLHFISSDPSHLICVTHTHTKSKPT